jgi:hypothetical protein
MPGGWSEKIRKTLSDGHEDRDHDIDDHADRDGARPAVGEPDARDAGGDPELVCRHADAHAESCRHL